MRRRGARSSSCAEAVDEEHDVRRRLGQLAAPVGADADVDAEGRATAGRTSPSDAVAVGRLDERRPSPAAAHAVRCAPRAHSAKASRPATASGPSAAARDPQREVVGGEHAGVAVVGLALGVGAAGRLEVDAG